MKKLAALILVLIAISCVYTLMESDDEINLDQENKKIIIMERQENNPMEIEEIDSDSSLMIDERSSYYRTRDYRLISQVIMVAFELLVYG
ncbi:hypothetical protein EZV73_18425 [Acidaminobacter sp. JC074]|uniref:hypothetical protein n=1 Tax=Acidaminobacter sp. JC074 TaxID=2530199 RepID=UPI001F0D2120|nr:hypothetical protein [Acidaminobacter sp. JC074]MCH4889564.1 hypothetical protein [Acidaminobacter sp. JC074]